MTVSECFLLTMVLGILLRVFIDIYDIRLHVFVVYSENLKIFLLFYAVDVIHANPDVTQCSIYDPASIIYVCQLGLFSKSTHWMRSRIANMIHCREMVAMSKNVYKGKMLL